MESEGGVGDGESVAAGGVAVPQTFGEPADAPFGSSVVEGVWHLLAVGFFLEVVVTDARGHVDGFLYVARLQRVEHLVVDVAPDSGKVVGLRQPDIARRTLLLLGRPHRIHRP